MSTLHDLYIKRSGTFTVKCRLYFVAKRHNKMCKNWVKEIPFADWLEREAYNFMFCYSRFYCKICAKRLRKMFGQNRSLTKLIINQNKIMIFKSVLKTNTRLLLFLYHSKSTLSDVFLSKALCKDSKFCSQDLGAVLFYLQDERLP